MAVFMSRGWRIVVVLVGAVAVSSVLVAITVSSGLRSNEPQPTAPSADSSQTTVEPDLPLDARWNDIESTFPAALRPAANVLRSYDAGAFPYARAACLSDVDAGGFSVSGFAVVESKPRDLDMATAIYLCAARFPITGNAKQITPLTQAELSRLYSDIARYRACIVEIGEKTETLGSVLSQQEFGDLWPAVGELPQPLPGVLSANAWGGIQRNCPEPDPRP